MNNMKAGSNYKNSLLQLFKYQAELNKYGILSLMEIEYMFKNFLKLNLNCGLHILISRSWSANETPSKYMVYLCIAREKELESIIRWKYVELSQEFLDSKPQSQIRSHPLAEKLSKSARTSN